MGIICLNIMLLGGIEKARRRELLHIHFVLFINLCLLITCLKNDTVRILNVFFKIVLCHLQKIPTPLFVLEIWKACFTGLIESPEGTEELKWTAFTFLKVRSITKLAFTLNVFL